MKKVIFLGGTEHRCGSISNPVNLVVGREYLVIKEDVHDWYTNYTLFGESGEYNSVWFKDVKGAQKKLHRAMTKELPTIGTRARLLEIEELNGVEVKVPITTSKVVGLSIFSIDLIEVLTASGSTYMVQLV